MRKLLLILSIICIAICAKAQVPTAVCSADKIVKSGDTFVVTVNINKCDLGCYAQYQQLLPEGFVAKEISGQSDNANFYFDNNKVFYQWYKLPIDKNVITLKYNVTVSQNVKAGTYDLFGYFSYQIKNRLGEIETSIKVEVK